VAPAARQGGTTDDPSGGVRLARGLDAPSGEVRLARGLNTPSGEVRLARGLHALSGEVRLARGHLHARRPHSCPRVRAFNALTPQDARHDPDTPGNRVPALFHQLLGRPSPPLCSTVRCGRCQPRDTVPPTPVRLTRRALEGGRRHPRMPFP
jgi:hypothetical protein